MNRKRIAIIGSSVLVISFAIAGANFAESDNSAIRNGTIKIENQIEADFPAMVKISLNQAVQDALAVVQGQVVKTRLENENNFLVYGVEVVTANRVIVDVKIDAGSGDVLSIDRNSLDDEKHGSGKNDDDRDHEG